MPEMTVCPVSPSYATLNVGSSSAMLTSDSASLSWSALDLGSIATDTTGSGNVIDSRTTASPWLPQIVSPVVVSFSPTAATICPALTPSISSRRFACICTSRPSRSRRPLVALNTIEPLFALPEYTLK